MVDKHEDRVYNSISNLMDILGENFIDRTGAAKYADIFFNVTKFVGIYFSAHWASSCQGFDPMLVEFYKKVNKNNKQIEILGKIT